jgi:SAM-dependent methyltransferase
MAGVPGFPDNAPLDFAELFAAEDRHFWFRRRVAVIGKVIARLVADLPPGYRVLEVGCGTGQVLRELERICHRGEVTGLDRFEEGLHFARGRTRCRLVKADLNHLPPDRPFDLIGMFDVLEHLPDDGSVLRGLHAALRPSGHLILTVPAHPRLWSYSDVYAQHYRRYAPAHLERVLRESGFEVPYRTQFMSALYPLLWFGRRWAALKASIRPAGTSAERELFLQELRPPGWLNRVMGALLRWEEPAVARGWRIPMGTSLLAVAQKRATFTTRVPYGPAIAA